MPSVPGRAWPANVPFAGQITDATTGKPYVRDGFVCDDRPGDFAFKDAAGKGTRDPQAAVTLEYVCPRTGKYCGSIGVGLNKPPIHPSWQWDGDFEKPTLSPSINCVSGCGWHGFLKAGVWSDA